MKKATKKLLSLFLAVLMLLSCFGAAAAAIVEREVTGMEPGEKYVFGEDDFLGNFKPEESGLYEAYVLNGIVNAYDGEDRLNGEEKNGGLDLGGTSLYYEKILLELESGKIYSFSCYGMDEDYDSFITISFVCAHSNKENKAAQEVVCGIGYTEGVYCKDCKRWLSGHEPVFESHTDINGDRVCDVCKKESVDASGYVSDEKNASYKLYSDGELVISGTGAVELPGVYVGDYDYCLDENVKKITVKEGITAIENADFYNYINLESLSIPGSLEAIEAPASIDSPYFEKFEVSPKSKAFSAQNGVLFSKDKKVLLAYPGGKEEKSYTVPGGVERIANDAFYYCSDLEALNFPESLRFVGCYAFPDSLAETEDFVSYVGPVAIGTEEPDEGELPDVIRVRKGTKIIAAGAFEYADVESVALPEGLVSISADAFYHTAVSSLLLPQTVKYIEDGAFSKCSVNSLVVPESVEYFGENHFRNFEAIAFLNPNCKIGALRNGYSFMEEDSYPVELIAGFSGSTAEKLAKESGSLFASLDEGHEHIYFCTEYVGATCTEDGRAVYSCPCGKAEPRAETIQTWGHSWYEESVDNDGTIHYECSFCGEAMEEKCGCVCHKDGIYKIFYKLVRIFWKLLRIKRICDCSIEHY